MARPQNNIGIAKWAASKRSGPFLIVDKPKVCGRGLPGRLSTHRPALTLARRSVAAHCASLRVLATSALRAFDGQRPGRECIFTHSSQSSIHIARKACLWLLLLTGLTSVCFRHRRRPPCAPQKMPEMTYTPSFLIAAPFFPYFVNALPHAKPLHAVFYAHPFLEKCGTNRGLLPSNS